MTVYSLPGLFQESILAFEGLGVLTGYDPLGNPIRATSNVIVYAQLDEDSGQFGRSPREEGYDPTEDAISFFKGHVLRVVGGDKVPPIGTVGRGNVNGRDGEVKIVSSGQASIAIATILFGERIRISFVSPIEYGG